MHAKFLDLSIVFDVYTSLDCVGPITSPELLIQYYDLEPQTSTIFIVPSQELVVYACFTNELCRHVISCRKDYMTLCGMHRWDGCSNQWIFIGNPPRVRREEAIHHVRRTIGDHPAAQHAEMCYPFIAFLRESKSLRKMCRKHRTHQKNAQPDGICIT